MALSPYKTLHKLFNKIFIFKLNSIFLNFRSGVEIPLQKTSTLFFSKTLHLLNVLSGVQRIMYA